MDAGLVIDSGWHYLYCLDADGFPQWVHRVGAKWAVSKIGNEPLTHLLGVDTGKHWVFGYDANAFGGIRQYSYDGRKVEFRDHRHGLGQTGDTAAGDSRLARHLLNP